MKRSTCLPALLAAVASVALIGTVHADTKTMRIAFSNNYAGNSWRQAMLKSYDIVTKKAVADGIVAAADVFTTADKEVPTQAAQIQNLILQGYNAIVINASSPDALNGATRSAAIRRERPSSSMAKRLGPRRLRRALCITETAKSP